MKIPASLYQIPRIRARLRLLRSTIGKTRVGPVLPRFNSTRIGVLIFLALFAAWMVFLVKPKPDGTLLGNYTMRPPGFAVKQ